MDWRKRILREEKHFYRHLCAPFKAFRPVCIMERGGGGGGGVWWNVVGQYFYDNLNLIVFISDLCETFREKKSFPSDQIGFMFMQSKSDW